MSEELPAPFTPPQCDLRDFPRMMLDINRLFASSFNAKASRDPLAWMVGHKLWYRSWHQVPAASLPDDDDELCYLAELGFDRVSWDKIRTMAMHGWIKCSDGRLYHPVVAEIALEAWDRKLRKRYNTECARIKKHNQRNNAEVPYPDYNTWISDGCNPVNLSSARPAGVPKMSPGTNTNVPREKASKGKDRKGYSIIEEANASSRQLAPHDAADDIRIAFEHHDELRRQHVPNARPVDLTPGRRKTIAECLENIGGLTAWDDVLAIVAASPFLLRTNSRGTFLPTIDWLLKPANLRKVREGNFDDNPVHLAPTNGSGNSPRVRPSAVDAIVAARANLGAD